MAVGLRKCRLFEVALCYAPSQKEAAVKVVALALRILADRFEHGEDVPSPFDELFCVPA
jgi:hypothetical protein